MGLDMYLYVEEYVSRKDYEKKDEQGEYADSTQFVAIAKELRAGKYLDENSWTGLTVNVPVGYWRKANAIHGWFVDNCADGVDECQPIRVSREDLEVLLENCQAVLSSPKSAEKVLPPQSGFFFGSTEVDKYYLEDLRYTVKLIKKLLADTKLDSVIYQASW